MCHLHDIHNNNNNTETHQQSSRNKNLESACGIQLFKVLKAVNAPPSDSSELEYAGNIKSLK